MSRQFCSNSLSYLSVQNTQLDKGLKTLTVRCHFLKVQKQFASIAVSAYLLLPDLKWGVGRNAMWADEVSVLIGRPFKSGQIDADRGRLTKISFIASTPLLGTQMVLAH